MILGDNSFGPDLESFINEFLDSDYNCKLLLKEVDNLEIFGVAYIANNKSIIVECSIILDNCFISSVKTSIYYSIIGEGTVIIRKKGLKESNRFVTSKNSIIYLK